MRIDYYFTNNNNWVLFTDLLVRFLIERYQFRLSFRLKARPKSFWNFPRENRVSGKMVCEQRVTIKMQNGLSKKNCAFHLLRETLEIRWRDISMDWKRCTRKRGNVALYRLCESIDLSARFFCNYYRWCFIFRLL